MNEREFLEAVAELITHCHACNGSGGILYGNGAFDHCRDCTPLRAEVKARLAMLDVVGAVMDNPHANA